MPTDSLPSSSKSASVYCMDCGKTHAPPVAVAVNDSCKASRRAKQISEALVQEADERGLGRC